MAIPSEKDLNLGFVARFFYRRETRRQLSELQSFTAILKSLDDYEIGELVVFGTHTRHGLEKTGNCVLDPFTLRLKNPYFLPETIRLIQQFKNRHNETAAASLMIWALSVRATSCLELLAAGRDMWCELSRGFPYIESAKAAVLSRTDTNVDISDATSIPFFLGK